MLDIFQQLIKYKYKKRKLLTQPKRRKENTKDYFLHKPNTVFIRLEALGYKYI